MYTYIKIKVNNAINRIQEKTFRSLVYTNKKYFSFDDLLTTNYFFLLSFSLGNFVTFSHDFLCFSGDWC